MEDKLITLAIHSYERAIILKSLLESEGIEAYIHNVNILIPQSYEGVRVRIRETDLPKALKIIEVSTFKDDVRVDEKTKKEKQKKLFLIPVDFSPYSLKACELGFRTAKEVDAKVVIAHVYYVPYMPVILSISDVTPIVAQERLDTDVKDAFERAEEEMTEFIAKIKALQEHEKVPNIEYSTIVREGIPEETIVEIGEELNPTLIVMGTSGSAKREILGSVTVEVIEQSKQKIVAVPEEASLKSLSSVNNIAFATNFDERALLAFNDLISLMGERKITYTIVHFDEKRGNLKDRERLEKMTNYLTVKYPDASIKYRLVTTDDMLSGLNEFLKEESIDLLSLTTHKRNPFSRLLYASFASKMLFCSKIPILVVRA